jgi:glycosyltransferase involved in cell wall biosynthesis
MVAGGRRTGALGVESLEPASVAIPEGWPGFVSVVVAVRNGARTIGEQLQALSVQDYGGAWELIVSDNGSTDGMTAVVDAWRGRLPAVRVVDSSAVTGAAHARNVALATAQGSFVAVCDADDVVSPSWLRELVAQGAPGAIVAGSYEVTTLNDPVTAAWTTWSDPNDPATGADLVRRGAEPKWDFLPVAQGCNVGLDRAVWQEIEGWSEDLSRSGEDIDFSWRAQLAGFDIRSAPDAVISYRLRPSITSTMRQYYSYGRSDVDLYVRFRSQGCPAPSVRRTLRSYASLVYRLPLAVTSDAWRGRWCRLVAHRAGRLAGSLRLRVLFP